jgi:hypothetical protein
MLFKYHQHKRGGETVGGINPHTWEAERRQAAPTPPDLPPHGWEAPDVPLTFHPVSEEDKKWKYKDDEEIMEVEESQSQQALSQWRWTGSGFYGKRYILGNVDDWYWMPSFISLSWETQISSFCHMPKYSEMLFLPSLSQRCSNQYQ